MANNSNIMLYIVGIVVTVFILQQMNIVPEFSAITETPEQAQQATETQLCPPGSDPSNTMTIGAQKAKWSPTTSMSSINARVFEVSQRVDGTYDSFKASNDLGSKSDSSTLTVAGLDKIGIIYGYDSSRTVNYYPRWVEITAPCKPFQSGSYDSGTNELVKNASSGITMTIKNSDSGLVNDYAGTYNETIEAGEYGYFDFTNIQTVEKEGISAATGPDGKVGNIVITIELNGTSYDEEVTTFGSLPSATVPVFYSVDNTDSKVRAFLAKGCPDPNQETVKYCQGAWGRLAVKAASGVNPSGGQTDGTPSAEGTGNGCVKVCLFDESWYLNTNTGAPEFGIAKDDGTSAGKFGDSGMCVTLDVT